MATPPRSVQELCTVNMVPCLSRLPATSLIKPCSVRLDAQAVSRYFTSVVLASRNSKQLEARPRVPTDEDPPHQSDERTLREEPEASTVRVSTDEDPPLQSDERTLQEEPEASTGDQKMEPVEEIVIPDSPKRPIVDEIIEISDSEDSVVEVETVLASKKQVPPSIPVPNTKSDTPPFAPKMTKVYDEVRYLCPKCKKHYLSKSAVSSHYAGAHGGSLRHNKIQQQVKKVYKCLICSVSLFNLINFQIHCDSIHNISIPVSNLVSTKIDTPVEKENDTLPVVSPKVGIPVEKENDTLPVVSPKVGIPVKKKNETLPVVSPKVGIPVEKKNDTLPVVSQKVNIPVEKKNDTLPVVSPNVDILVQNENVPLAVDTSKDSDSIMSDRTVKENCVVTSTSDMSPKSDTENNTKNPADQQNDTVENVDVKHYCEKCDMMFGSIDELVLHNKKAHLRKRNSTPTYTAQVNIEADKKETNKYECSKCNRKFSSEADRNNHCKLDHHLPHQQDRDEFCCKYCHKCFKDVAQFFFHLGKEHAAMHENILEQSQHTVQDYTTETSHRMSRDADLPEKNVSDVDMDSVTSSHEVDNIPQPVTEHSKSCSTEARTPDRNIFFCSTCNKRFAHKQSLQTHLSKYHNKSKQRYIVMVNEGKDASGKFMCLICHKRFQSRNGASMHYSIIHDKPVAQATPKVQRYVSTSSGMVQCTVCRKPFSSKKSAHDHFNKFHSFSEKPVAQVMPQMNPIELGKPQNSAMKPSPSTTMPFETVFIESLDPSDVAKMKSSNPVINEQRTVESSLSDKQTFEKFKCLNCYQQFDTNVALANHHCSELSQENNQTLQSEPSTISVCQICCQDFTTNLQDIFCPPCKLEVNTSENERSDRPGTSNDRFDGESDFLDSKADIIDHTLHRTNLSSQEEVDPTKPSNPKTSQSMIGDHLLPSQAAVEPTKSKNPIMQIFQCDKCCRLFINKFAQSKHVCQINNPLAYRYEHENIPCIYCNELCANIYQAAQHRRQKHAYVCLICKKDFETEQVLKAHNAQIHLELLTRVCSICSRKFKSALECIDHIKCCHDISSTKSAIEFCKAVVTGPKLLGNIYCPFCELNFKTFAVLNYHFIKKHQMLQCLTCDNYFIFNHSSDTQCTQCNNLTSDASNSTLAPDQKDEQLESTKKRKQESVEQEAGDTNEGCCRTRGLENWQARKKLKSATVIESQENAADVTESSHPILVNYGSLCNTCQNPITTGDTCNICSTGASQPMVTEQNICITCKNLITTGDTCNICSTETSQPMATEQNICITCKNLITTGDTCKICSTETSQPMVTKQINCITCKNPITIGDKCDTCSTDISLPLTTESNIPDANQNPTVLPDKCGLSTNVKSVSDNCPTPVAMHRVIRICVTCGKLVSSGDICQFCSGSASKSYDITVSQSQDSPSLESHDMPASKSHTNLPSNSVQVPASNTYTMFQSILATKSYSNPNLNKCKTCGKMLPPQGECLLCKTNLQPLSVPSSSTSGQSSSTNNPSSNSVSTQKLYKILGFKCKLCQIWLKSIPGLSTHMKTAHNLNMNVPVGTVTFDTQQ